MRCFTQDDAHIFCRPDQVKGEFIKVMDIIQRVFKTFNFSDENVEVQISLRDPKNYEVVASQRQERSGNTEKYIGSDEDWASAEQAIIDDRNEKIGRKIRDNELKHIPYMLVVGEKEAADATVAVRKQGGEPLGTMSFADFAKLITDEVAEQTAAC